MMKDYSLRNDNIKLINALATSIGEHMTELFENGYDQGYVDGQKEKLANAMIHDHEVAEKTAYEQGLNDAWECARKISMPENEGGMSVKALQSIFGKAREIFNCTASEAIAKIKEYEDKARNDMADIELVIKIPKNNYNQIKSTDDFYLSVEERLIKNGIPIPDNATNEDVAELVWGFKPRENTCIIPKTECNGNPAECDGCSFDDWWKEPYQKGGKE